jgi:hypothetical protein
MHGERQASRWAGWREELRRLVGQALCAAGGLGGLWLGFLAAPRHSPSTDLLTSFAEVLVPVGWHVAAGVLTGALMAWAASMAVPWLRPPAAER